MGFLSFIYERITQAVLIVAAGDAKIDNPKYKAEFGKKEKMLSPGEVETFVGHAVGGVCPFAVKEGVKVYLDVSLKRFDTVFHITCIPHFQTRSKSIIQDITYAALFICEFLDPFRQLLQLRL